MIHIWRRIAKSSFVDATRFCEELTSAAESLTTFPHRNGTLRNRPSIRKLAFRSYLILYQINEEAHTVEILRFWHAARDQRRLRLKEEAAPPYEAAKVGA